MSTVEMRMYQSTNSYLGVFSSGENKTAIYSEDSFCRTLEQFSEKSHDAMDMGNDRDATSIKEIIEQNKLTAQELKEDDDWRDMSDDDWDKLLAGVDNYIDAYKADIRERAKKQLEAAQKAALEADPEMRSAAAQEAALSVAASGFDGGADVAGDTSDKAVGEDPGIDHEKNWTRKLKTDDQVVLRTAKAAQAMESMALSWMEEIASSGMSAYESYDGISERFMRDRRFVNFA